MIEYFTTILLIASFDSSLLLNDFPTSTPRRIHVDSTSILRRYVEDQISTNFHVISTYFFPCNFNGRKSTLFPRTFFNVISMVEISTLFPLIFFDVILMGKKLTSFLESCKLMKTFEEVFLCL